MEFFTISHEKRPIRLCEETRKFAWNSLNHVYGRDTSKTRGVAMDDIDGFNDLPPIDKYDIAIRRIAEKAPLRVCPNEKISGAATLGISIGHAVPFTLGGNVIMGSVSHLTIDFETVLRAIMIPDVNMEEKHLEKLADLYRSLSNCLYIELLPYHPYGNAKSERIGVTEPALYQTPEKDEILVFSEKLRGMGVRVKCYGTEVL